MESALDSRQPTPTDAHRRLGADERDLTCLQCSLM
jgi:hypothetical protein